MERIAAIEGLRAWLAWTVVVFHVAQVTGINRTSTLGHLSAVAATEAVFLFIIISGFVITGLVLTRRESWPRYITRRAFRIFPAYLVALLASAVTMYLARDALAFMPWRTIEAFNYDEFIQNAIGSVEANPVAHWLLHLTLLQGLPNNDVLLHSQTAILGPSWSLSLEWQFYLLAPAAIWLLRKPRWSIALVVLIIAGAAAYRIGLFGHYNLPSLILGAGHYFLIGIASRFAFDRLRDGPTPPLAALLGLLGLAILFMSAAAIFVWAAFLLFLTGETRWRGAEGHCAAIGSALFSSAPARWLGARSYSVYIIHWPIVQLAIYFILPLHTFGQWQAFAVLLPVVAIGTFVASDLMYRFIERPMIALGARLASGSRRQSGRTLDEAVQAKTP